jgi:small subunit ribosomal protein S13
MVRIVGVSIPDNKKILVALTYVYGIGSSLSKDILGKAKIDVDKRVKDLTQEEINSIRSAIEGTYTIEGELKREILGSVRRLKDIGSWRGMRHTKGLPVRGQRTKTNNRTVRGNKRTTVGSGKKPAATPT